MLQCTVLSTVFLDEFESYKQVEAHSNCSRVKQGITHSHTDLLGLGVIYNEILSH